jgi:hypothetical protein
MREARFLVFILLMSLVFLSPAYALTITPSIISNQFGAGAGTQGVINVYNEQDVPIKVNIEFGDWGFAEDGSGKIVFKPQGSIPYSCANWIQAEPKAFELGPKEIQQVNYSMSLPTNAVGGYYGVIFFVGERKNLPAPSEASNTTAVFRQRARLGVLIYNEVSGTKKKVTLTNFNVYRPNNKSVKVEYQMKNEGTGYVRSEGKFHIMDDNGKLYGNGMLSPAGMQQGGSTKAEGEWIGELPAGEYNLVMTLELKPFGEEVIVKEKKFKVENK